MNTALCRYFRPAYCRRRERAAGRGQDLVGRDLAHATVMDQPAYRFMAWPTREHAFGFDDAGERIERRPVPRTRWTENPDRGRAQSRSDMQEAGIVGDRDGSRREREDGVAQVVAGEVARPAITGDFRCQRLFVWAA